MGLGYTVRASRSMVVHPMQGVERVRGRMDRRQDKRQLEALRVPSSDLYGAVTDWAARLHAALELPWPCPAATSFDQVWDSIIADLTDAGVRVGMFSYGGWNDSDRAFAEAIWCIVAHVRPASVVETGVAHGLTSRVILEGLDRYGSGHLWSIDLPAVDSALHPEIGVAVPEGLRSRWTYVQGTSRERLPHLLAELGKIDIFIHDSLHTGRNQVFELKSAWAAMRPGGVAVVDDIDHSLAFRTFVDEASPGRWLAAGHVAGSGLWGVAIKAGKPAGPSPHSPGPLAHRERRTVTSRRVARAANIRAIEANPQYKALTQLMRTQAARERRHERIEGTVVREIAYVIRRLALCESRLLHIQAQQGLQTLLFRDQLIRPERPVIYDEEDVRGPEARAETSLAEVDFEATELPAPSGHFHLVVWNRDLVTLKNVVPTFREVRRVLQPGGFLVVAVPNLAALHNRLLLLAGRQPTTLHINNGDHVRGFAGPSMTRFLELDLGFRIERVIGVGLAPITGAVLPRPLRGLSHTIVWVLRKPGAGTQDRLSVPEAAGKVPSARSGP
ncbi:MAG: class I SAM-dependent methyltransferase [Streptosporangiaceae bacterium]